MWCCWQPCVHWWIHVYMHTVLYCAWMYDFITSWVTCSTWFPAFIFLSSSGKHLTSTLTSIQSDSRNTDCISHMPSSFRYIIAGYGSAFGEKYGNADRVEVACAALVRHGYSYVGKVHPTVQCSAVQCSLTLLSVLLVSLLSSPPFPYLAPPFSYFPSPSSTLSSFYLSFLDLFLPAIALLPTHHLNSPAGSHSVYIRNIHSFHCGLNSVSVSDVDMFTVGYLHFRYIRWAPADVHLLRACVLPEAQAHGHGQNARES